MSKWSHSQTGPSLSELSATEPLDSTSCLRRGTFALSAGPLDRLLRGCVAHRAASSQVKGYFPVGEVLLTTYLTTKLTTNFGGQIWWSIRQSHCL